MNDEEFRLLDEIEEGHWWFRGKRMILRSLLERHRPEGAHGAPRLLDLGCGTGGVLRDQSGEVHCFGADRSALALRICRDKGFGRLVRADLARVPFAPDAFDVVLALDLIEHLEDDVGFLRQAAHLCRPGGRMIVAVPAFPSLWSQHDVTFEHHRRYRAAGLREVVTAAGFEVERITHTNTLLFPAAAFWRIVVGRLRSGGGQGHDFYPVPGFVNALLAFAYRFEAWWLRRADFPFGVSVVCVARRPGPSAPPEPERVPSPPEAPA